MYSETDWMKEWEHDDKVRFPATFDGYTVDGVRRPLILFRGKPITHEEVVTLLAKEEPLFKGWDDSEEGQSHDRRMDRGILRNVFYRSGYSWLSTFILMDGYIGGSYLEWKYPNLDECIPKWIYFAKRNPNLDMVIAYTSNDESLCYCCGMINCDRDGSKEETPNHYCSDEQTAMCKKIKSCLGKYNDDYKNKSMEALVWRSYDSTLHGNEAYNTIQFTIWIHNGEVDILIDDDAVNKFKEYDKLYSTPELRVLDSSSFYSPESYCICSEEDIREAFKAAGLSEDCYDTAIKLNLINKPSDGAIRLTKEYIVKEVGAVLQKYDIKL